MQKEEFELQKEFHGEECQEDQNGSESSENQDVIVEEDCESSPKRETSLLKTKNNIHSQEKSSSIALLSPPNALNGKIRELNSEDKQGLNKRFKYSIEEFKCEDDEKILQKAAPPKKILKNIENNPNENKNIIFINNVSIHCQLESSEQSKKKNTHFRISY